MTERRVDAVCSSATGALAFSRYEVPHSWDKPDGNCWQLGCLPLPVTFLTATCSPRRTRRRLITPQMLPHRWAGGNPVRLPPTTFPERSQRDVSARRALVGELSVMRLTLAAATTTGRRMAHPLVVRGGGVGRGRRCAEGSLYVVELSAVAALSRCANVGTSVDQGRDREAGAIFLAVAIRRSSTLNPWWV